MKTDTKMYKETYKNLIGTSDPVIASGWGSRPLTEILYLINSIIKKLQTCSDDVILDIGCGSGILSIPIAATVNKIIMTDFIPEMIQFAKETCAGVPNMEFFELDILDPKDFHKLPSFNKILGNSILQSLGSEQSVVTALKNVANHTKCGDIILFGANADLEFKDKYIDGFKNLNISESEREKKIQMNKSGFWLEKKFVLSAARDLGFDAKISKPPKELWQSWYMFDLELIRK